VKQNDAVSDVLAYLSDGKVHSLQDIADHCEISKSTAQRIVASLSYNYAINIIRGRGNKQGVQLDVVDFLKRTVFSKSDLQVIIKGLTLLQESNSGVSDVKIQRIIDLITTPTKKEDEYARDDYRWRETCWLFKKISR